VVSNINAAAWSGTATNGKAGTLTLRSGTYPRIGFEQDP